MNSVSRSSTPPSPTDTLQNSSPASPKVKAITASTSSFFQNPRIPASSIIEYVASRSRNSSSVYIYDLAEQAGFGILTKTWKQLEGTAPIISLQTRAGAALSLVGRLSEGTSKDTGHGAVLTAYTSLTGLAMMAPALAYLPAATPSSRLIIQVPILASSGEDFSFSPSLASLATAFSILPKDVVIIISASPQESVDFAQLAYRFTSSHVIHLFDQHSYSREIGHSIEDTLDKVDNSGDVSSILQQAGYSFFRYSGHPDAETVIVMMSGPLAIVAMALAEQEATFGVITVSVLRPWDESALLAVIPKTANVVHVLDDVPNLITQGSLYIDVFGTIVSAGSSVSVRDHRITPAQTHSFFYQKNVFFGFLAELGGLKPSSALLPSHTKKLLFFGAPSSPLSHLPHVIENVFLSNKGVSARLLTDHDVVTKPGGIFASRFILSPKSESRDYIPVPIALPLDSESNGEVDFIGVLDSSLLKSHSILKYAKPKSTVLVVTAWAPAELISNLLVETLTLINDRELRLFTIDARAIASTFSAAEDLLNTIQTLVVHLAFLRLYLGAAAQEPLVLKLASRIWEESIQGVELLKINSHTWSALEELDTPVLLPTDSSQTASLKQFEFNAVAVDTDDKEYPSSVARLGSWHDAAKHLLFPAVYTPSLFSLDSEEFPQNPALRPEVPDRTFLVTCTVNRRLTPVEYDRNVFHLEFDTSGTGLKYSIGEALGIHGWNDEREVMDFCSWYGVDPKFLITIPIVAGEGRMHTRTVLQALQQQIDLFGRPPKSFYTDLAAYATSSVEKHALLFIGSPEGSATFKKLSEKDTVTFADILRMYPSARPGIETLCELVGDIKPRHYSIASAQSVVGDRVDLLIVTVDWLTPSGAS